MNRPYIMMPAGIYYVGDLSLCFKGNDAIVGSCYMSQGLLLLGNRLCYVTFKVGSDGDYVDQRGRAYTVESCSIGCVAIDELPPDTNFSNGHRIIFKRPFRCFRTEDKLHFGSITIDLMTEDSEDESLA